MTSLAARQTILEQLLLGAIRQHDLKPLFNPIRISTISRQSRPKLCLLTFRSFTSTPLLSKKGGKKRVIEPIDSKDELPSITEDPFDFSILETAIAKNLKKLKDDFSKLRTGGRFNPEVLENLRVELNKETKLRVKLGELAQVIPKGGRTVMIIIGEKDHVKPITSAIQSARELNLQPQPDPHNPQQLNVPIPPPTKESRDQAVREVTKAGDIANTGIKNARAMMQKRFRSMELERTVRPDNLNKAHKDMEKVVQNSLKDIKEVVDTTKKAMEQS